MSDPTIIGETVTGAQVYGRNPLQGEFEVRRNIMRQASANAHSLLQENMSPEYMAALHAGLMIELIAATERCEATIAQCVSDLEATIQSEGETLRGKIQQNMEQAASELPIIEQFTRGVETAMQQVAEAYESRDQDVTVQCPMKAAVAGLGDLLETAAQDIRDTPPDVRAQYYAEYQARKGRIAEGMEAVQDRINADRMSFDQRWAVSVEGGSPYVQAVAEQAARRQEAIENHKQHGRDSFEHDLTPYDPGFDLGDIKRCVTCTRCYVGGKWSTEEEHGVTLHSGTCEYLGIAIASVECSSCELHERKEPQVEEGSKDEP